MIEVRDFAPTKLLQHIKIFTSSNSIFKNMKNLLYRIKSGVILIKIKKNRQDIYFLPIFIHE